MGHTSLCAFGIIAALTANITFTYRRLRLKGYAPSTHSLGGCFGRRIDVGAWRRNRYHGATRTPSDFQDSWLVTLSLYLLQYQGCHMYYCILSVSTRCLRHCAISRKVAGSIPDSVIKIFNWLNPSGRTMALGSTQPLTEMSTRGIPWGVKAAGA
jgi:hypothetical protein